MDDYTKMLNILKQLDSSLSEYNSNINRLNDKLNNWNRTAKDVVTILNNSYNMVVS